MTFDEWLTVLRRKWSTVPAAGDRVTTTDLLQMPDAQLLAYWENERLKATTGDNYAVRGWYHTLYRDQWRGQRVLDVGAGLGMDALTFSEAGAHMTLLDIVPDNVELHRRLAGLLGVEVESVCIEGLGTFESLGEFDVIWAQGSLINAPFARMRQEAAALVKHLPVGGRWVELCYPKERWQREGSLPFSEWGNHTDGEGTPWMEWYDLPRLLERLDPASFEPVLAMNYHHDDFNWFDLIRRS